MRLTENAFWQASLALYQRPGMQSRLLEAQDKEGRNVNLELLRILLSGNEPTLCPPAAPLSETDYQHLHEVVMAFSRTHTQKVRQLRRELSASKALDQKSREQLKSQLLAAELCLERQEQVILINALRGLRSDG